MVLDTLRQNISFILTYISQLFPAKPTWSADHLPDLSGKVYIVTGANTGIGRETVKRLLLKNARVYLAARSKSKAERAIEEIREETGKEALLLLLDLGDLNSVKAAAEEYKRRESQLDGLILNAGVLYPGAGQLTAQGYDATMGTNVVGHFLFFQLLYPLLVASGRESDPARVVWLSSVAHYKSLALRFEAYKDGPALKAADPLDQYSDSKVAAILLSKRLARTCTKDNVVSVAVDPGNIKSQIYRSSPWYLQLFDRYYYYPVEYGALGSLYAGAAPEGASLNGKYLLPWARVGEPNRLAYNEQVQDELWAWLEEQVRPFL
ncbi:NAD-P-binding protein [Trametes polyzona]|nr:NAD-P-binding protein [Trametes polyzona]